jgi:hypothetical protein
MGRPRGLRATCAQAVQEVYLFAELDADGRFARIEETALMLEGAESDREMGSMK